MLALRSFLEPDKPGRKHLTPEIMTSWLKEQHIPTARELCDTYTLSIGGWSMSFDIDNYRMRDRVTTEVSWSIPCQEVLDAIKPTGTVLDLGAGTGYWTALMRAQGIDARPYDCGSWYKHTVAKFHPVIPETALDAVVNNHGATLFCSWPSYDEPWLTNAIACATPGTTLHLIGEGEGGCTGDDNLHRDLEQEWKEVEEIGIPCWDGIHDYYRRYVKS